MAAAGVPVHPGWHPGPMARDHSNLLTEFREAAQSGAAILEPESGWRWRDEGPVPAEWAFDLPAVARRTTRWLATTEVPGPARGLAIAPDGTAVVAYDPPQRSTRPPTVLVRAGDGLEKVIARYDALNAPVAVSGDGRWFAASEQEWAVNAARIERGTSVVPLTGETAATHWTVRSLFGWLPPEGESPARLVALNRHPNDRSTPTSGPAAGDLAALETNGAIRVVVADIAADRITALAGSREVDESQYRGANFAVAARAGVAVVAAPGHLVAVPLDGRPPSWVQPPTSIRSPISISWYAAAVSACDRFVAFGGNHWHDEPNLLVIEAATGRMLLALNTRALGTTAPVRALAFHPARWLAVGFGDGQVRHLTLTGSVVAYRGLPGSLAALAFTPDGTGLLAAGTTDRGIRHIALTDHEQRQRR
jgi:hypothetical protein